MAIPESLDTTAITRVQDTAMITEVPDTTSTEVPDASGVPNMISIGVPGATVPRTVETAIAEILEIARTKNADHPRNR